MTEPATTAAPAPSANPWTYRLHLIWFVALIVLSTLWFERHLKAFVSQTAIIGGTVTLFGLWKLVIDALRFGSSEGPDDWIKRAFTSARATEYLGFATLLLTALYFCTSSIYLTFEGETRGQSSFLVEQRQGDRLLEKPEPLNSYDRFRGKPYFFHFRGEPVEFRITEPAGYEPLTVKWGVASQHTIRVPGDFKRKELHLLQIVPGVQLLGELPMDADKPGRRYKLEMRKTGATGAESSVTIFPYVQTVVYTGMSGEELKATANAAARDVTRRSVQEWLTRLNVPPEKQAPAIAQLFEEPQLHAIERLIADDQLEMTLSVLKQDETGAEVVKVLARQNFKVPGDGTAAHFILLEPAPGGGT